MHFSLATIALVGGLLLQAAASPIIDERSERRPKPVIVVKKPTQQTNGNSNGDGNMFNGNLNNNGEWNSNEHNSIGKRERASRPKPKVVVVKPTEQTNGNSYGDDNAFNGNMNNNGEWNTNLHNSIGKRERASRPKPKIVVVKPTEQTNGNSYGDDNAFNGNLNNNGEHNSNYLNSIGKRERASRPKPKIVVVKPTEQTNGNSVGDDNAFNGNMNNNGNYNSNYGNAIGKRERASRPKPKIVVIKPTEQTNGNSVGDDNAFNGNMNNNGNFNSNLGNAIGKRERASRPKPKIVVVKPTEQTNGNSYGDWNAYNGNLNNNGEYNTNYGNAIGKRDMEEVDLMVRDLFDAGYLDDDLE